ncbi:MAG: hypothetical protein [Olavius algarvensis Delta 4 endosymbiont]|nr:MAG: hypothetical protein [Olavius algarvensis Delta 4 endosymbiont]
MERLSFKRRVTLAALLLVIGTLCHPPAGVSAGELVVGTSTGYPPYYYMEKGDLTGVCVELINHAAQSLGLMVTYKQYPWKRMLHSGKTGRVDAIMPLFKTPERETFLLFPDAELALEENHIFTRRAARVHFSGKLTDIAPHPVGVVTGYSYGKVFDAATYLDKIVTRNDLNLLQMFKHRRFAVGVGNRHVVRYFADRVGGVHDLVFLEPPLTRAPLFIAFSRKKGHTRLTAEFAQALRDFKRTRAGRDILARYGMAP